MLKVLMYLFENYIDNDVRLISDQNLIGVELAKAGFNSMEIEQAMSWLQGFLQQQAYQGITTHNEHNFRVFNEEESNRLNLEAQGLLANLEQMNVITPRIREVIIDRLMALDYEIIEPVDVKWVVMMVLFHQKDSKAALTFMQDMVMHGDTIH